MKRFKKASLNMFLNTKGYQVSVYTLYTFHEVIVAKMYN